MKRRIFAFMILPNGALLSCSRQEKLEMKNSIHNLETKLIENDSGQFWAVVMGLDLHDHETIDPFMDHVVSQWKNQRMTSDPDTQNMTITIAGYMTADEFADLWTSRYATDPILKTFMERMVVADALHISKGEVLDHQTLIPSKAEQ